MRIFKEEKIQILKNKAALDNRILVFQDESTIRLLPSRSRCYSPKGQSPIIQCDGINKQYVGISGVISKSGQLYYEVREKEGFKKKGLTRFLNNCRKKMRKDLLLVWDNAPTHKSIEIKNYLAKQDKENPAIWLENIPAYSPELNPVEQLWAYLKKSLANQFFKTTKELKAAVINVLEEVKKNKKLIIAFFKHKDLNCYQFFK